MGISKKLGLILCDRERKRKKEKERDGCLMVELGVTHVGLRYARGRVMLKFQPDGFSNGISSQMLLGCSISWVFRKLWCECVRWISFREMDFIKKREEGGSRGERSCVNQLINQRFLNHYGLTKTLNITSKDLNKVKSGFNINELPFF